MTERRKHERVTLDAPLFCDVTPGDGRAFVAIVRDVCLGGLRLELPPDGYLPAPGERLRISDCDECVAWVLDGLDAEVAWVGGGHCGLRLVRPELLDAVTLRRIREDCCLD
ncbi:MAG TPA: PilZ domain-containing protein [Desulfovibrio sp.]|jgi:hypothetical protein|uniref:PilZ domain-containing protein n=1 Tax=Desulfovibrio TaxID=872 RepID=UPI00040F2014|nr:MULTISPECIES: PilZ domain-containing protein [Desulfovibrio]MDY0306365.1 PilZ domain-containing protein [Desulfovibrionaceae bacterium]HMM40230.1 PilZ domain-containing protein [Desulfovibrio sp.]